MMVVRSPYVKKIDSLSRSFRNARRSDDRLVPNHCDDTEPLLPGPAADGRTRHDDTNVIGERYSVEDVAENPFAEVSR